MSKAKKESNLSRLLKEAGKYRFLTYCSLLLSALSAAMAIMVFVYLYFILEEAVGLYPDYSGDNNMVNNAWIALGFSLGSFFVYIAGLICSHLSAFRIASNIRKKAISHVMELSIGEIERFGSGRLRKIIIDSSGAGETYLAHLLPDMVGALVTPIAIIVVLVVFDWRLGLISLIPAVLGFACMFTMTGPKMKEDMKNYQDAIEGVNNQAVEYVRGIPVVKTFNQTIHSFSRFKKSIEDYSNFCLSYTKRCRWPMVFFEVFVNSVFAFIIGAALIMEGNSWTDSSFLLNLMFYIVFTPIISNTLMKVMFMSENGMIVSDALDRIDSIMGLKPLEEGRGDLPKDHSIELRDVSFSYEKGGKKAIDGISLFIKSNSKVALVGPSGGGKSTTASLIARFYDVDEGKILIGGADIRDMKKDDLNAMVSLVFQNNRLFNGSILENMRMADKDASEQEVLEALHKAQCDDILERLEEGIHAQYGSKGTYFSGGEIQRLCIARAFLKKSKILIFDEATAYFDAENEYKVQLAINELSKDKTVVMIAHRLSSLSGVDKVYVVDEGRLVESGSPEELLEKGGLYKTMHDRFLSSVKWRIGQ